jgi:serpin B
LPKTIDGLARLEGAVTEPKLEVWLAKLSSHRVQVALPRFRLTEQIELKSTLSALGMSLAFDAGAADFSGMTGKRDLAISAVVHKAYVDVEETGTEAAAATGVVMKRAMAVAAPPVVFRADHPFLFLIRDNGTNSILFLGRLVRP